MVSVSSFEAFSSTTPTMAVDRQLMDNPQVPSGKTEENDDDENINDKKFYYIHNWQ